RHRPEGRPVGGARRPGRQRVLPAPPGRAARRGLACDRDGGPIVNDSNVVDDPTAVGQLFEPTVVGPLTLRNSFVMAPMTRSRSPQATPTAEVVEYYRRRAAGGVGLIITEGVLVDHPSAGHDPMVPRLDERSGAGWAPVVDAIHGEG